MSDLLTPKQAEAVVRSRIEAFGLGALPEVHVSVRSDGRWLVHWDEYQRVVPPMARDAWAAWLVRHVGPLDAESLVTSES